MSLNRFLRNGWRDWMPASKEMESMLNSKNRWNIVSLYFVSPICGCEIITEHPVKSLMINRSVVYSPLFWIPGYISHFAVIFINSINYEKQSPPPAIYSDSFSLDRPACATADTISHQRYLMANK
jgi:hypothetical protein